MISIHALLAESDTIFAVRPYDAPIFLSTLSLRRATGTQLTVADVYKISIHALLAESDDTGKESWPSRSNFYPRSPCGERQQLPKIGKCACTISIHALLAESDRGLTLLYIDCRISIHALLAESDST